VESQIHIFLMHFYFNQQRKKGSHVKLSMILLSLLLLAVNSSAEKLPFIGKAGYSNFVGSGVIYGYVKIAENGDMEIVECGLYSCHTDYKGKYKEIIDAREELYYALTSTHISLVNKDGTVRQDCYFSGPADNELCSLELNFIYKFNSQTAKYDISNGALENFAYESLGGQYKKFYGNLYRETGDLITKTNENGEIIFCLKDTETCKTKMETLVEFEALLKQN
jgi:hypothetical protein